jgi:ribonucleoside-triphosphate reductase
MSMRNLETIEKDIVDVKAQLANVRGSETEVYARIVGYYRSVRNWNKGKKDEFKHRKEFVLAAPVGLQTADLPSQKITADCACASAQTEEKTFSSVAADLAKTIAHYEFYSRKTCPNCPAVRDYLASCPLKGTTIDVDTSDGFAKAADNGVYAAPTVIMYNAAGDEIIRVHNKTELASVVSREAIAV